MRQRESLGRDLCAPGQHLYTRRLRFAQCLAVRRVDATGAADPRNAAVEYAEQQHAARARIEHLTQRCQVFAAPLAHRIGEQALTAIHTQCHRLHFDVHPPRGPAEQQVRPAAASVGHLRGDFGVAFQPGYTLRLQGFLHYPVGQRRVNTGKTTGGLHQLPGMRVLAFAVGRLRQPYTGARLGTARHGAGVGAVHSQCFARRHCHIRQEALVAAYQATLQQRSKLHYASTRDSRLTASSRRSILVA